MKTKYEPLRQKYGLPKFEELDPDFELYTIENDAYPLKEIAKKFGEKAEFFANILEEQIQPENSLCAMHECDNYDENEKKMLFEVYRKLMRLYRSYVLLELKYDEKVYADFIKEFWNEWQEIRLSVAKLVNTMRSTWTNHKKGDSDLEYFG